MKSVFRLTIRKSVSIFRFNFSNTLPCEYQSPNSMKERGAEFYSAIFFSRRKVSAVINDDEGEVMFENFGGSLGSDFSSQGTDLSFHPRRRKERELDQLIRKIRQLKSLGLMCLVDDLLALLFWWHLCLTTYGSPRRGRQPPGIPF